MRGFAARSEASTDKPASEILHEKREQDRQKRDAQGSTGAQWWSLTASFSTPSR